MDQLIATLLDCPNLSLRVLDTNGRSIKTLNQEQLRRYFGNNQPACSRECANLACDKRADSQI